MTTDLNSITLQTKLDGEIVQASTLWQDGPVLIVCLRRPGCLLCREEAIHLWSERAKFEQIGVKLVCILHEWKDREVEAFKEYWGGDIYYDEAKAFYGIVHGGKPKRGNVLDLLNPFSRAWKNMKRAKESGKVKDSNLVGDGLTLGGLLIVRKGGGVAYTFAEATFGDHAPFEEILSNATKAAAA